MEIVNAEQSVVLITSGSVSDFTQADFLSEWIGDHAVAGLEANLRLEGILTDCTEHLQWDVWAVEQASVVCNLSLVSDNNEVGA